MSLSYETLNYLALVLSQQSVSAADANFDETVAVISKARRELLEALAETQKDGQ